MKLLAVNADSKTIKGVKYGFLTGILYLAPNILSGYQVCPKATEGCKAACLYSAGRGAYSKVKNARINKTKWFFEERQTFMQQLHTDIVALIKKAQKENLQPAVRLNGTSDIAWEKISYKINGVKYRSIMHAFPNINFYDYTKIPNRKFAQSLKNYYLIFSLAENNQKDAIDAINSGMNISVVFNMKKKDKKPKFWSGYRVIDGDAHDVRLIDKKKSIVALTAKGKARYDKTGFVKNLTDILVGV